VILESAEQEVVERSPKEEPEGSCSNDMSMNGEGYVTNTHFEVFCTSEGVGGAAGCAFHAEDTLRVDLCANFLCKIFPNNNDL
jgi:hypothetical protein